MAFETDDDGARSVTSETSESSYTWAPNDQRGPNDFILLLDEHCRAIYDSTSKKTAQRRWRFICLLTGCPHTSHQGRAQAPSGFWYPTAVCGNTTKARADLGNLNKGDFQCLKEKRQAEMNGIDSEDDASSQAPPKEGDKGRTTFMDPSSSHTGSGASSRSGAGDFHVLEVNGCKVIVEGDEALHRHQGRGSRVLLRNVSERMALEEATQSWYMVNEKNKKSVTDKAGADDAMDRGASILRKFGSRAAAEAWLASQGSPPGSDYSDSEEDSRDSRRRKKNARKSKGRRDRRRRDKKKKRHGRRYSSSEEDSSSDDSSSSGSDSSGSSRGGGRRGRRGAKKRSSKHASTKICTPAPDSDSSTGNEREVFGVDISDERGMRKLLDPSGSSSKEGDKLADLLIDALELPGAYNRVYSEKDERDTREESMVQALKALGKKKSEFTANISKVRLDKIKKISDLQHLTDQLREEAPKGMKHQNDHVRAFLQRKGYSREESEEFVSNSVWCKIVHTTLDLYLGLIAQVNSLCQAEERWDDEIRGLARHTLRHHMSKLSVTRGYATDRRNMLITQYAYLRDAASKNYSDERIGREALKEMASERAEERFNLHEEVERLVAEKIKAAKVDRGDRGDKADRGNKSKCAHCLTPELHDRAGAGAGRHACPLKDIEKSSVAKKAARIALDKTEGLMGSAFDAVIKKIVEEHT